MSETATILRPRTYFGALRVIRLLGKGGMGEVYLVEDPKTLYLYAMKVVDPNSPKVDSNFVSRFVREVMFVMNVHHPNLIEVYDSGVDPATDLAYMTMEYLSGGSLRDLLSRGKQIPMARIRRIAKQMASVLAFIEENGLVHRDIKPENILFNVDGTLKLADLGISRFDSRQDATVTSASKMMGTPAYMSPEQMMNSHEVDIRSDMYSFGIVLYEMLTGRRPNEDENAMASLAKALQGREFPDVRMVRPNTPPEYAELVADLLKPNREDRPPSMSCVIPRLDYAVTRTFVKTVVQLDGKRVEKMQVHLRLRHLPRFTLAKVWTFCRHCAELIVATLIACLIVGLIIYCWEIPIR